MRINTLKRLWQQIRHITYRRNVSVRTASFSHRLKAPKLIMSVYLCHAASVQPTLIYEMHTSLHIALHCRQKELLSCPMQSWWNLPQERTLPKTQLSVFDPTRRNHVTTNTALISSYNEQCNLKRNFLQSHWRQKAFSLQGEVLHIFSTALL